MATSVISETVRARVRRARAANSSGSPGPRLGAHPAASRWPPRTALLVAGLTTALLLAAGTVASIRFSQASDAAAPQRVSALDQTLRRALVSGDARAVDAVLSPRFELIDPSGDRQARGHYLVSVSSGDLDYEAFDPITPVEVRVSGDVAVVTYESQLQVSAGDIHLRHRAWHTHVYEQAGGRWLQVWSQATAVGGFPPSGG